MELILQEEGVSFLSVDAQAVLSNLYDKYLGHPYCSVDISFCSLVEMQTLNQEKRGIAEPTDVLSFPTTTTQEARLATPQTVPLLLGSVVICPEKAEKYGETIPELVHHGILHLLGFDHETDTLGWDTIEIPLIHIANTRGLPIRGRHDLAQLP